MIDPGISRCAAPLCFTKWHRMSEGKLFAFHVKHPPSELRQMKNVWLCEECFESWNVTLDTDGKVELCPLERMAQPDGWGNPGFSAKRLHHYL
jgi:hypothetical protein